MGGATGGSGGTILVRAGRRLRDAAYRALSPIDAALHFARRRPFPPLHLRRHVGDYGQRIDNHQPGCMLTGTPVAESGAGHSGANEFVLGLSVWS